MEEIILILCSISSENSEVFCRRLIEEKKAACVSIINGVQSIYWWQNKIETEGESILLIKSTRAKLSDIKEFINNHHPYDTPELIVFAPSEVGDKYKEWVANTLE